MKLRTACLGLMRVELGCASAPATADDAAYVGSKKCKKCHLDEYQSWAQTKMAVAFEPRHGAEALPGSAESA